MSLFNRSNGSPAARSSSKVDPAILGRSVSKLPALPALAIRVLELARDVNSSPWELVKVISKDPALAATILRSINSSAMGLSRPVDSLDRAIPLLGLREVANLAVKQGMSSLFTTVRLGRHFMSSDLWDHCNGVATLARRLAMPAGRGVADVAYMAGLVHDIGLVVLCQQQASPMNRLIDLAETDATTPLNAHESATLGFDHADLGQYVATAWGLPESICLAVGYHHAPLTAPDTGRKLAAIVAIADQLCCEARHGLWVTAHGQSPTPELLTAAGVSQSVFEQVRTECASLLAGASVTEAA